MRPAPQAGELEREPEERRDLFLADLDPGRHRRLERIRPAVLEAGPAELEGRQIRDPEDRRAGRPIMTVA